MAVVGLSDQIISVGGAELVLSDQTFSNHQLEVY